MRVRYTKSFNRRCRNYGGDVKWHDAREEIAQTDIDSEHRRNV